MRKCTTVYKSIRRYTKVYTGIRKIYRSSVLCTCVLINAQSLLELKPEYAQEFPTPFENYQ